VQWFGAGGVQQWQCSVFTTLHLVADDLSTHL
jgi:hypothetical protein